MISLRGTRESAVAYPKVAFLVIAAIAAGAPRASQQQAPEPTPASTPTDAAAVTTGSSSEADETAALIAKANAAAAANANARAASMTTRTLTRIEASAAARKKASEFGFRAEVYNGTTLFCKQDAALGSRIPLTRCMTADEFDDYAVQLKIARDMIQSKAGCNSGKVVGSLCGGLP